MNFSNDLIPGRLIKRYKRFLVDVMLAGGQTVTSHCANPGAMTGLAEPGMSVYLSPANNPDRKLKFNWELVKIGDGLVGINTSHPNRIVS